MDSFNSLDNIMPNHHLDQQHGSTTGSQEADYWKEQANLYKLRYETEQHLLTQLLQSKTDTSSAAGELDGSLNHVPKRSFGFHGNDSLTAVTFATNNTGIEEEDEEEEEMEEKSQDVESCVNPAKQQQQQQQRSLAFAGNDSVTAVTFATNTTGGNLEEEDEEHPEHNNKVYYTRKSILKKDPPTVTPTIATGTADPITAMKSQVMTEEAHSQQETVRLLNHAAHSLPVTSITTGGVGDNTFRNRSSNNAALLQGGSKLKFTDVNFVVAKKGKKDKNGPNEKRILTRVSGTVSHGHVLAIMGPSGAGKTTLINVLTLDAGIIGRKTKITGSVTLNGSKLTGNLFKKQCFVVKQQDKHWPYLTVRETLQFAAGFYDVASDGQIPKVVDKMIKKMGLSRCADDTKCCNLSGGQKRRLSIAVALLKQPTVLFLDEPTSGLDAAAASSIMSEITRVAKEENLIVVCTIHQPSTKVYNGFDQVMILSRGREAFHGGHRDAIPYFTEIGYALPEETNPAEHFLDLVNSDFSGEQEVLNILDEWENRHHDPKSIHYRDPKTKGNHDDDDDDENAEEAPPHQAPLQREIALMFRRHFTLIIRDPVLYFGRCVIFLVMNMIFSLVYWNARKNELDQIYNKLWIQIWFIAVPLNMGVVAVYALNDEFKSIQREAHNGMSRPFTYILAKSFLVLPIFFIFGVFALLLPSFVVQAIPWSAFVQCLLLYAAMMFLHESVAETLSVAFSDPIMGMLGYTAFWFGGFLFAGVLIAPEDLYWPFKFFFYFMPLGYYARTIMYITLTATDWCDAYVEARDGTINMLTADDMLLTLNAVNPVIDTEDRVWADILTLLGYGIFWKLVYIYLVITESRKVAKIKGNKKQH